MVLSTIKNYINKRLSNLFVKGIATVDFSKRSNEGFFSSTVDLLKDEVKDKLIFLQNYGFYSVPRKNAQCFVVFPNGSRDEGFILKAFESVNEPNNSDDGINSGDIMIKHYSGVKIHFNDDGINIEVPDALNTPIEINAKFVNINLKTGGKFSVAGDNLTVDA